MAKSNLIKLTSNEPPQNDSADIGFGILARRLAETAEHIQDISDLLYQHQDLSHVIMGASILLGTYATEVKDAANWLDPKPDKGGAQ